MKQLPIAILAGFLLTACGNSDEEPISTELINSSASGFENDEADEKPVFIFEEEVFNFGKITQGEKVNYVYRFANDGQADLVIASVEGSCGCTVSKNWPRDPVEPGDVGEIEVEFDSEEQEGEIKKYVSIVANTVPATRRLVIEGEVVVPNVLK